MRLADVDKILKDLENNPNLDFSMCDACWGEIYTTIDNAPEVEPDYEKAIEALEKIRKAYESDYQIDDVIQVCAELWGVKGE